MEVIFADPDLDRLETDITYTARWPQSIVTAYRRRIQQIRAAVDERDLRVPGNRLEKLKGPRSHQHSMRLNEQYRLILELKSSEHTVVRIVAIEDYH